MRNHLHSIHGVITNPFARWNESGGRVARRALMQDLMFNGYVFYTRNCVIFLEISSATLIVVITDGQGNLKEDISKVMVIVVPIDNRVRVPDNSLIRFTVMSVSVNGEPDHNRHCTPQWRLNQCFYSITVWARCFIWSCWRHQMETFPALLATCAGNSPVNSPHKGQWRWALMFSLICTRINDWVNNGEAGDLRRHLIHYDVTVRFYIFEHFRS